MKSAASVSGHPIHAMLVPFPIAFLLGGFIADVAARLAASIDLAIAGYYAIAAGLVAGLVSAVPGAVDFALTVPPASSGRRRARRHLLANAAALVLFALAWYLRGGPGVRPEPVLLWLEAIGACLLALGGWMGATLVYRDGIGVDAG